MKERNGATRQKGFTLIELLVVMAVLGVLAALVMPTVTGVKTGGETASGKSDAKSVEDAINNFNTNSRSQGYPEDSITSPDSGTTWVINGKNVASSLITAQISDLTITNTTQISWTAQTLVRQKNGTLISQGFVPDFLLSKPKSAEWVTGGVGSADELLWLLKKGTAGDNVGRTLIVLRLNQAGSGYEVVRK